MFNQGKGMVKMSRPRPPSLVRIYPTGRSSQDARHCGICGRSGLGAAWTTGFQLVFPGCHGNKWPDFGKRKEKLPEVSRCWIQTWYQIRCVSCVGRKSLASSKYAIVDLEGFCNVGIHTPLVSSTLCINCICSDTRNDARLHPCKMLQFTSHVFVIQSLNSYLL
jgi:hypothetical protein